MRLCSQLHLALVEASSKICLFFLRSLWLLDDLLHGMSGLLALLVHWDHWPQFLSDLAINVDAIDCVEPILVRLHSPVKPALPSQLLNIPQTKYFHNQRDPLNALVQSDSLQHSISPDDSHNGSFSMFAFGRSIFPLHWLCSFWIIRYQPNPLATFMNGVAVLIRIKLDYSAIQKQARGCQDQDLRPWKVELLLCFFFNIFYLKVSMDSKKSLSFPSSFGALITL